MLVFHSMKVNSRGAMNVLLLISLGLLLVVLAGKTFNFLST